MFVEQEQVGALKVSGTRIGGKPSPTAIERTKQLRVDPMRETQMAEEALLAELRGSGNQIVEVTTNESAD